jgi:hypothetical protein
MYVDTYIEIASSGPLVEFNDIAAECPFSADKEPEQKKAHMSRFRSLPSKRQIFAYIKRQYYSQ